VVSREAVASDLRDDCLRRQEKSSLEGGDMFGEYNGIL